MHEVYTYDFERFLAATNEKEVLRGEIVQDIDEAHPSSILDIGAGNGDLSIPLSRRIPRYTAVEKNPLYVERLKNAGINVKDGVFPLSLQDNYDFILASHVISYSDGTMGDFIDSAWSHLEENGRFLIVTYRGEEDDWTRLRRRLGFDVTTTNQEGFKALTEQLEGLGTLDIRKVQTLVRTSNSKEMIDALSFVASNGIPKKRKQFMEQDEEISQILEESYQADNGYYFPFQHFFLKTRKI